MAIVRSCTNSSTSSLTPFHHFHPILSRVSGRQSVPNDIYSILEKPHQPTDRRVPIRWIQIHAVPRTLHPSIPLPSISIPKAPYPPHSSTPQFHVHLSFPQVQVQVHPCICSSTPIRIPTHRSGGTSNPIHCDAMHCNAMQARTWIINTYTHTHLHMHIHTCK